THNLRYNKILHESVIVLSVATAQTPHIGPKEQLMVEKLGQGVYSVRIRYGFMQDPNVPESLMRVNAQGVALDPDDITYFLGRETIVVTERPGMAMWREKLF